MKPIRLLIAVWLLTALAMPVPAESDSAQLTVDPAMVKGPPSAPVTIVEFSDYQ